MAADRAPKRRPKPEGDQASPSAPSRSRPTAKLKSPAGDEAATSAWSPLSVVRVETTVQKTYDRETGLRKYPVAFKPDREIDSDETWMFTDGGGTGWHGLVVLRRDQPHVSWRAGSAWR